MTDIAVRGTATPEELAAVLAVVSRVETPQVQASDQPDRYLRWRRTRLAALRRAHRDQER
jgi:hypothetical protein